MMPTLVVCKPRLPDEYLTQRLDLKRQLAEVQDAQVMYLPVFELIPNASVLVEIAQWVGMETIKPNRVMVFVSPSVLEIVVTQFGSWPEGLYCGVMGSQSARLAEQLGIPEQCIIAPSGNSTDESEDADGLARLLSSRFQLGSCEVLVCKGPRGRVDFPLKLRDMHHNVTVLECYDRRAVQQTSEQSSLLFQLASNAVLWITSSETVEVLDAQLQSKSVPDLQRFKTQARVLTTHPRITSKCRELGYLHVEQIPTGIQSVHKWLKSNKKDMENNNQASTVQASAPTRLDAGSNRPDAEQSKSDWLGKAAFFISVVSFVLVLLIAFAGKNQIEKTRMAFGERIQKESTTLDLVKEEIGKSSDLTKDLKTRFDLLETAQKEEASQRASLEEVYNNLLSSRTELSLSEVDQLVSIAKRQLYLLGNVKGASIALTQAVELLEGTEKPSLLNLRTALEKDLSEINSLPTDDLLKLAISLDSVVNSVESLPMLSSVQATTDQTLAEITEDEAQTPVAASAAAQQMPTANLFEQALRSLQSLAKTVWYDVKSLIEVTKVDNPEVLMLSSRQEMDLRNTLRLSLLNARISLLSRQGVLLKSDLERSSSLLDTYFDTKSVQVQRAQSVIGEIREVQLDLVLPELQATSAALRLAVAGQQGERQ